MRKTLFLIVCLLATLTANSRNWQTWNCKGCLVSNWEDPAPVDDAKGNHWYSPDYDDTGWSDLQVPIESFQEFGAYYVRSTFTLSDDFEEYDWRLFVDSDDNAEYYVNGVLVGNSSTGGMKSLSIDKTILKADGNIIAAVVTDNGGSIQYLYFDIQKVEYSAKGVFVDSWDAPAPANDANDNKWYSVNYDDSEWTLTPMPLESFKEYGACYVRSTFTLPENFQNFGWKMNVQSDDFANIYVNGQFIGETNNGSFAIDNAFLKANDNLFAAVVYDNGGTQYLYFDIEKSASITKNGFLYELENGIVSVSNIEGYEYAANAKFESKIVIDGHEYDVTRIQSMRNMQSVYIPSTIRSIAEYGRWGTFNNVNSISVDENNTVFTTIDGSLYDKSVTTLLWGANKKEVVVPEGVKSLAPYAFFGCGNLENISLPSTLEGTLHRIFEGCSNLQSVNIPAGVTSIEYNFFSGCSSLKSIYLNTSLPYLNRLGVGFGGVDTNSCEIHVPVGSKDLYQVFKEWCEFKNIIEETNLVATDISNIQNGYLYEIENGEASVSDLNIYYNSNHFIQENVTLNGISYPVTKLKSIIHQTGEFNIPYFIKSIDSGRWGTFNSYDNDVPSITVDGNNGYFTAIDGCLYNKDMSELLVGINNKNIIIPEGVKTIAPYGFWGCNELESIKLPSTLHGTLHRVFDGCTNLKSIDIPEGVTGLDYYCFAGCSKLTDISIPASVEWFNYEVFVGCEQLESVTIPNPNFTFGESEFRDCKQLKELNINVPKPQLIQKDVFANIDLSQVVLTVPHGSKALYESAPVWQDFGTIVELDNALSISDAKGFVGSRVVLPVCMNNTAEISAVQFDLYLPDGITLAQDTDGFDLVEIAGRTTEKKHSTIETSLQPNGSIRVLCASNKNYTFEGNEGAILNLTLNIGSEVADGDYFITIKDVTLSTAASVGYEQPVFVSKLSVSSYEMGDLNKDTKINVVDYTALVSMIMGTDGGAFPLELADFSGNGKVDVTDLTAIVNKIMNGASSSAKSVKRTALKSAAAPEENRLSLIPFAIAPGEEKEVSLQMFNTAEISAYQTDVVLPEGIEIVKDEDDFYLVEVSTRTTYKKHNTMEAEEQTDGSIRLMCASSKNAVFDGNEGEVAVITVKASSTLEPGVYNITLKNTILSTADSYGYEPEPSSHSAIVGSPEIASVTLHGDYTADAISELNTALASNTVLSAIDFTEATSVDASTKIETGNKNLLVYVSEGTDVANSQNVVEGDECESLVLTDGYNFSAPKAFTAVSASYSRMAPSTYGTTVLPFVPSTSGAEFYELTGVTPTCFEFQKVVSPVAGTPYLYRATTDNFTATNAEIAATEAGKVTASGWTMQGTYTKEVFDAEDDVYAVSDDKVYCNIGTLTMNPFRAYFTGNTSGTPMNISIDGTTVIGSVENSELAIDGAAFNLAGQKVSKSYKGIVITNGKKEIRK